MTYEHTWSIVRMDRRLEDGYVHTLHWRLNSTLNGVSTGSYGSAQLLLGESNPEIPYSSISENIALGWLFGVIDRDLYEEKHISELSAPAGGSGLPW